MKIMLDGHNLGLKEPTGIGVYAHNLASNLHQMGHEVHTLYSMRYGSKRFPDNLSFFQKLAIEGETDSSGVFRWIYHALPYTLSMLTGITRQPKIVDVAFDVHNKGLERKIAPYSKIYNLPYIYRVSQAYAAFSGKSLSVGIPAEIDNLDIFHMTLPLPLRKGKFKKVVTLHDLIPLKLPLSTNINLRHYSNILKASLKDADLIFAVSEKTKQDAIEILKLPDKKIHVTYQASLIPESIKTKCEEDIVPVLERYGLGFKKYFIFYGAIEPKKNVLRVLQAFTKAKTDFKLVVLGKNGWLYSNEAKFFEDEARNQKLRSRIVRIPYSDFLEMMLLLKGAKALLFPSLYEGFGLPVLEAMQLGIPVITSDLGALPEVGGDAAYYVDPYSLEEIKSAIERLSIDDSMAVSMVAKGYQQATKFSDKNYRERLSSGYRKLS